MKIRILFLAFMLALSLCDGRSEVVAQPAAAVRWGMVDDSDRLHKLMLNWASKHFHLEPPKLRDWEDLSVCVEGDHIAIIRMRRVYRISSEAGGTVTSKSARACFIEAKDVLVKNITVTPESLWEIRVNGSMEDRDGISLDFVDVTIALRHDQLGGPVFYFESSESRTR